MEFMLQSQKSYCFIFLLKRSRYLRRTNKMHKLRVLSLSIILVMVLSLIGPTFQVSAAPRAQTSPPLNYLLSYSVVGGGSITNVPTTYTSGDIGVSPGTATGGGYSGTGVLHSNDSSAINAQAETLTIFGALDQGCDYGPYVAVTDLSTLDVGAGPGNLPFGVYCAATTFQVTTTLNLTGSGVWIFKTGTTLITAAGSTVTGGDPCNVWWRVGSSTTLGVNSSFIGTVVSQTGVNSMNSGAVLDGRFLALSGATVTLDANTITGPACVSTTSTALSAGSITAGATAFDTATLSGTNGSTASGSVTYNVYSDPTCVSAVYASAALPIITPGTLPNSPTYSFPSVGTYYWRATYNGDFYNQISTSACGAEVLTVTSTTSLPSTGFAPNRITALPVQPADMAYKAMGDLWLEIPKLGVQMNILGIPPVNGGWDVSWLGSNAGWLQGSAFPTWAGNSVLTGHVWNANNTAGPFSGINGLWWGDKIVVHAWGAQYVYQVRSVSLVGPGNTTAMMKHEELPWVTLVTCRGYDQASDSYKYRILVRAVLMEVK
jgi:LPXTG-site transpeptidase (sortase) family protein